MMTHAYSRYLLGALCLLGLLRPAIGKLNCGSCDGDLTEHSSVYVTFKCDVCNNIMRKKDGVPSIMYGCSRRKKCDYDACAACYSKHTDADTNSSTSDMSVSEGSVSSGLEKKHEEIMNREMHEKLQWAKEQVTKFRSSNITVGGKKLQFNLGKFKLEKVDELTLVAELEGVTDIKERLYKVVMKTVTDRFGATRPVLSHFTLVNASKISVNIESLSEADRWDLYTVLGIYRDASLMFKTTRNCRISIETKLAKSFDRKITRWEVDDAGNTKVILAGSEGETLELKQFGLEGNEDKFVISVQDCTEMTFGADVNDGDDDIQLFLAAEHVANPNTGKFQYAYLTALALFK